MNPDQLSTATLSRERFDSEHYGTPGGPPLFDERTEWDSLRARATDPVTSHLAAAKVNTRDSQMAVLRCLARTGPLADHEIVQWLQDFDHSPLSESRIRTARHELEVRGLVKHDGMFTKTPRGRMTQVWVVTGLGHHEIAEAKR